MIQPCLNNFKIRYLLIIILQFYLVLNRFLLVLPFWLLRTTKYLKVTSIVDPENITGVIQFQLGSIFSNVF